MTREIGFYWVQHPPAGEWVIGYFNGDRFLLCGGDTGFFPEDFEQIGPRVERAAGFGFTVGDRIRHVTAGDGDVTRIDGEGVRVKYDSGASGCFDEAWFAMYPKSPSKI